MRALLCGLLFAAVGAAPAPSSADFHRLYGDPDDSERYTARPYILAEVAYGSDHFACEVLLKPLAHHPLWQEGSLDTGNPAHQIDYPPVMSAKTASEILDEIAPVTVLGKKLNEWKSQNDHQDIEFTDYENATSRRFVTDMKPPDPLLLEADIYFKRSVCAGPPKMPN